jgi:hypothetical protein
MNYSGDERRLENKWHFKKDVSLADILSFAAAALAVVYAYTTLDKRVSIVETTLLQQRSVDARQDEDSIRLKASLDITLDRMNLKLDRLLENQAQRYRDKP